MPRAFLVQRYPQFTLTPVLPVSLWESLSHLRLWDTYPQIQVLWGSPQSLKSHEKGVANLPQFSMGHADMCAHQKERKCEEAAFATQLSRDDYSDHKDLWPKDGTTTLKNCFPGTETNEETLGKSEGNCALLPVKQNASWALINTRTS